MCVDNLRVKATKVARQPNRYGEIESGLSPQAMNRDSPGAKFVGP
jgi:hypothetical protein